MYRIAAILVAVALAIQMTRWGWSRIVKRRQAGSPSPLDALVEQMRRQATSGDFTTRVEFDADSAFAPLAEQYNRVLNAVQRRERETTRSHHNAEQLLKENAELRERVAELAHINLQAVGREQRLIELQNEVNEMARRLGETDHYDLPIDQQRGQIRLRA
jgi:methyl-accepting chemotaxis protein